MWFKVEPLFYVAGPHGKKSGHRSCEEADTSHRTRHFWTYSFWDPKIVTSITAFTDSQGISPARSLMIGPGSPQTPTAPRELGIHSPALMGLPHPVGTGPSTFCPTCLIQATAKLMGRVGQRRKTTAMPRARTQVSGGALIRAPHGLLEGTVRAAPAQIFQTAWYSYLMG